MELNSSTNGKQVRKRVHESVFWTIMPGYLIFTKAPKTGFGHHIHFYYNFLDTIDTHIAYKNIHGFKSYDPCK